MLIKRLMEYNGKSEFAEDEIEEIKAILNLLECLDPEGKYLKDSSAKISLGIDHGDSTNRVAQIISFPTQEK